MATYVRIPVATHEELRRWVQGLPQSARDSYAYALSSALKLLLWTLPLEEHRVLVDRIYVDFEIRTDGESFENRPSA